MPEGSRQNPVFSPKEPGSFKNVAKLSKRYLLVVCYIAIEHVPFSSLICLLKMVVFHSYVSLPGGMIFFGVARTKKWLPLNRPSPQTFAVQITHPDKIIYIIIYITIYIYSYKYIWYRPATPPSPPRDGDGS